MPVTELDPSLDSVYRCIAEQRRRHALAYLQGSDDGTASLDALVDHVVQEETHSPSPDRECVSIDLYHRHLPMLDEANVIEFDPEAEIAEYNGHPEIERVVDSLV